MKEPITSGYSNKKKNSFRKNEFAVVKYFRKILKNLNNIKKNTVYE